MAFRPPNYRQQRGDRDRAKEQKKRERLERREADAQKRREERDGLAGPEAGISEPATTETATTPQGSPETE
jgi:hypothetical protein